MGADIRTDAVSVTGLLYCATAKNGGMCIDMGDVLWHIQAVLIFTQKTRQQEAVYED